MKNLPIIITRLLVLSALFVIGASGNTVSLDTTFNGTGYSIYPAVPSPGESIADSMALQPDGKIVIGGHTVVNQSPDQFVVMRLNSDGTLDNSFGTGGIVLTRVGLSANASKVLIQPDGKILLAGHTATNESALDFAIIRYNADGSLDTSFNSTGYLIQSTSGLTFDGCHDMALQPDGKIILVGSSAPIPGTPNLQYDFAVMRFNPNGSLDTGFNGTGILTFGTPNVEESAQAVLVLTDGKILIGGRRSVNQNVANFVLMRRNADGSPDTSFGSGGTTVTNAGQIYHYIQTLALQSDGKILAGGTSYVARYTTRGILDTSFGVNGVAFVSELTKIKVLADDKFLLAPRVGARPSRYMKDGAPDTNFNSGVSIPGQLCLQGGIEVQPDGKILLGGYCSANNDDISRFAAFRLQETQTKRHLDFTGDSITDLSLFRPSTGHWLYADFFGNQIFSAQFGTSTDRPIPADFTGDGRADVAVFRPSTGEWFVLRSENGTFYSFPFGTAGDIPIADDYDGDQIADAGVFRPSTGLWYIQKSTGGSITATFGTAGDKPVPSDYDGDFKTDIAIYRPSSGEWWIQRSSDNSVYAFQFGASSDKPVPGDYTGDNKTDAAFWRPSTGEWFILRSEDSSYYSIPFGLSDDLPAPGNYVGDGRFDLVVFRPSTNRWHIQPTGGTYFYRDFGAAGDQPVPNVFVP